MADFAVVLVDAAVGTMLGAEVEFWSIGIKRGKVNLAGERFAGFIGDVKFDG